MTVGVPRNFSLRRYPPEAPDSLPVSLSKAISPDLPPCTAVPLQRAACDSPGSDRCTHCLLPSAHDASAVCNPVHTHGSRREHETRSTRSTDNQIACVNTRSGCRRDEIKRKGPRDGRQAAASADGACCPRRSLGDALLGHPDCNHRLVRRE
jgi:hypothetical protein